ncbi:haloacid dehalogenase type II [Pseudooceanicola sp.]|uniref:haloacid dehalogenase type II n=1 Tax=Pseudooceanicola sp. TaxID=1914328 RepID=UPI0035C70577
MPITTCVFDAYGTLFDVSAAARLAAQEPDMQPLAECWAALAEDWRRKQLEYSWLRAVTGVHCDFWQVTQDGLNWAMEARGITDAPIRDRLLQLYRELAAYPEVPGMLAQLKQMGQSTAILSNGSPGMLADAVASAGVGDLLDDVLSVERVGIFKPAAQVYDLVEERFGTRADQVLFVSSNGWDAASAKAYGFTVAWVNRRGDPVDRLPGRPDHVLSDLSGITELKVF